MIAQSTNFPNYCMSEPKWMLNSNYIVYKGVGVIHRREGNRQVLAIATEIIREEKFQSQFYRSQKNKKS